MNRRIQRSPRASAVIANACVVSKEAIMHYGLGRGQDSSNGRHSGDRDF